MKGRGPLTNCGLSARILGGLDRRLGDRAVQPTGGFLPVPVHDVDPVANTSKNDALGNDVAAASGRLLIVNTTAGGDGDRASAPARDFNPTSFGLDIPANVSELRESVEMKIFSATGIPPGLGSMVSSSQAVSSLYRQWLSGPVSGLAARAAKELEFKLEVAPITFGFDAMGHRPLVERATAIKRMVRGRRRCRGSSSSMRALVDEHRHDPEALGIGSVERRYFENPRSRTVQTREPSLRGVADRRGGISQGHSTSSQGVAWETRTRTVVPSTQRFASSRQVHRTARHHNYWKRGRDRRIGSYERQSRCEK